MAITGHKFYKYTDSGNSNLTFDFVVFDSDLESATGELESNILDYNLTLPLTSNILANIPIVTLIEVPAGTNNASNPATLQKSDFDGNSLGLVNDISIDSSGFATGAISFSNRDYSDISFRIPAYGRVTSTAYTFAVIPMFIWVRFSDGLYACGSAINSPCSTRAQSTNAIYSTGIHLYQGLSVLPSANTIGVAKWSGTYTSNSTFVDNFTVFPYTGTYAVITYVQGYDALARFLISNSYEVDPSDNTAPDTTPTNPIGTGNPSDQSTDELPDRSNRSTTGLYSIYSVTNANLNTLGSYLWSKDFIDNMTKAINDPIDAIISLHYLPVTPTSQGVQEVYLGNQDAGFSAELCTDFTKLDYGTIAVQRPRGMFLDNAPYTKLKIHVPFCGIFDINTDEVMGNTIHLISYVDNLSGGVVSALSVTTDTATKTLYVWSGQAGQELPVTGRNYASIYMGVIGGITNTAIGVAGTVATGGAAAPLLAGQVASGISSVANGVMSSKPTVNHGSAGSSGFSDVKQAYLIWEYPRLSYLGRGTDKAYSGIPTNRVSELSSLTGFTTVDYVNLSVAGATDSELDEIKGLLQSGVIL